jgi:hypothetical protein
MDSGVFVSLRLTERDQGDQRRSLTRTRRSPQPVKEKGKETFFQQAIWYTTYRSR